MTETSATKCPFCRPDPARVFHVGQLVLGIWDAFPASPGHALLIPKRHIASWFEATPEECGALLSAADVARDRIEKTRAPDGYNIGINVGEAAGQTVDHLHVHVIPRYLGDVLDPRGGVRHVIPSRGNYLVPGTTIDAIPGTASAPSTPVRTPSSRGVATSWPLAVGAEYTRAEIPLACGIEPDPAFRSQTLVTAGSRLFLIVTLGDESTPGARGTVSRLVAPDVLEWHARGGAKLADLLSAGSDDAAVAEVFVRKTAKSSEGAVPYTYCGEAELDGRVTEKPLVVRWKLRAPAPQRLC